MVGETIGTVNSDTAAVLRVCQEAANAISITGVHGPDSPYTRRVVEWIVTAPTPVETVARVAAAASVFATRVYILDEGDGLDFELSPENIVDSYTNGLFGLVAQCYEMTGGGSDAE
jgi:hypothetical protein